MRILLIAYYLPPTGGAGAIRWTKLAKYLSRDGFEISAISVDGSGFTDNSLLAEAQSAFASIERVPALFKGGGTSLRHPWTDYFLLPDNKLWWVPAVRRSAHRISADVVIATVPPFSAALAGIGVARSLGIPFVLDFRDSFLLDPNTITLPPLHRRLRERIFRYVMERTTGAVAVREPIAQELRAFGDVVVIPNGYDPDDFNYEVEPQGGRLLITYTGRVFDTLNFPMAFLEGVRIASETAALPIEVRFVGGVEPRLAREIACLNLSDTVEIVPSVEHKDSVTMLLESDALLAYIDNRPLNINALPSKLMEYAGAGRRIIAAVPYLSPAAEVVCRYALGDVISPDNPKEIAELLVKFSEMKEKGELMQPSPVPDFSFEHLAARYGNFLRNI